MTVNYCWLLATCYISLVASSISASPLSSENIEDVGELIFKSLRVLHGRPTDKFGMLGQLQRKLKDETLSKYVQKQPETFDQKVDHFDESNKATWKQEYFFRLDNFDNTSTSKAPVFLMLGGEGYTGDFFLDDGQMAVNGRQHKAAMFSLEHRYYGESVPTSGSSVAELKYLSSEQALADAAAFIKFAKGKYGIGDSHKWIVFGGSYSGNLAAWFRLKYPNLVAGAIASSAPVQALMDFNAYLAVVDTDLGEKCLSELSSAMKEFTSLMGSTSGRKELSRKLKLKPEIEGASKLDLALLGLIMASPFAHAAQYDDSRNVAVEGVCSVLIDNQGNSSETALDRLGNLVRHGRPFIHYQYQGFIDWLVKQEFSPVRMWIYQTCTEFGYYQTSDYPGQPFGELISLDFYVQTCIDVYGPQFDQAAIEAAVERTNKNYGGADVASTNLTNVVFPNGEVDPWHMLSVLKPVASKPSVIPILIPGTSHCADMMPQGYYDPQALKDARAQVTKAIGQFLEGSR